MKKQASNVQSFKLADLGNLFWNWNFNQIGFFILIC